MFHQYNNHDAELEANKRGYFLGQLYQGSRIEGFKFGCTMNLERTVACVIMVNGKHVTRDLFLR